VSEVNIYLFLYPKEVFHILKKQKEQKRKKKASAKQKKRATQKNQKCGCPNLPRLKLVRSGLSVLSDFTKPVNLSDFTRAETGPIRLVRFVRFYQACELIRFYQG
jgi:hypothetical protein